MSGKLKPVREIENFSGVSILRIHGAVKPLKQRHYRVIDVPIPGDAPKNFIRAYKYGAGKRWKSATWPYYIAKVGHKWYPIESITEYVLNRLGEFFGVCMAEADLRLVHGQIRFLSRYFLKRDKENLVHGAQIYAAYLDEPDLAFVDEIEQAQLSRELLTFQVTVMAIERMFPEHADYIIHDFIKMLVFDAIVGNNDRHFYNWGVIIDVKGNKRPRFSPVYDTARGMFWNLDEERVAQMQTKAHKSTQYDFEKYMNRSMPKIGWDGRKKINHFELIEQIFHDYPPYREICKGLLKDVYLEQAINWLKKECKTLFSEVRLALIQECLKIRFEKLQKICHS